MLLGGTTLHTTRNTTRTLELKVRVFFTMSTTGLHLTVGLEGFSARSIRFSHHNGYLGYRNYPGRTGRARDEEDCRVRHRACASHRRGDERPPHETRTRKRTGDEPWREGSTEAT
jgi:hypothetical protein